MISAGRTTITTRWLVVMLVDFGFVDGDKVESIENAMKSLIFKIYH